jgi:hypothetical protein
MNCKINKTKSNGRDSAISILKGVTKGDKKESIGPKKI